MSQHIHASSPASYWLSLGQYALKKGSRAEAVSAFRQAVAADPYHIEALMWLAAHCDDPRESLHHLARVLSLDAHYAPAHEGIRWARKRLIQREATTRPVGRQTGPRPQRSVRVSWPQAAIALCLLLGVVLSGAIVWALQLPITEVKAASTDQAMDVSIEPLELPESKLPARARPTPTYAERADKILSELDPVWAQHDWEQAAPLIAQAMAFRPDDASLRRKLMAAYFNQAVTLIDAGELERALNAFDQALEIMPGDPQAQAERDTLVNYMAGLEQFNQRQWASAAQRLSKVYSADAGYLDARGLLYRSYYQQGLELKEGKDWENAFKMFQSAVTIDGDAAEARNELAQAKAALIPPEPGASGEKWIDINLTTQRFRALQGQQVIYTFVTSTGENARPTTPGRYQILDKIPNAYSSFWNLWMPYWMGIYWAGSSENGIHALPILSNGQTLWAGFLGRRVSFGCVILDTSAAKLMYDWAEIGTPVIIHY